MVMPLYPTCNLGNLLHLKHFFFYFLLYKIFSDVNSFYFKARKARCYLDGISLKALSTCIDPALRELRYDRKVLPGSREFLLL